MSEEESGAAHEIELLEHNLQHLAMQKQASNVELSETMNALNELNNTHEEVYRMVGNIMVHADKPTLQKELEEQKHMLESRMHSIEKQEVLLEAKVKELRRELIDNQKAKR